MIYRFFFLADTLDEEGKEEVAGIDVNIGDLGESCRRVIGKKGDPCKGLNKTFTIKNDFPKLYLQQKCFELHHMTANGRSFFFYTRVGFL